MVWGAEPGERLNKKDLERRRDHSRDSSGLSGLAVPAPDTAGRSTARFCALGGAILAARQAQAHRVPGRPSRHNRGVAAADVCRGLWVALQRRGTHTGSGQPRGETAAAGYPGRLRLPPSARLLVMGWGGGGGWGAQLLPPCRQLQFSAAFPRARAGRPGVLQLWALSQLSGQPWTGRAQDRRSALDNSPLKPSSSRVQLRANTDSSLSWS